MMWAPRKSPQSIHWCVTAHAMSVSCDFGGMLLITIAPAIRHITTDHVCFPAIIASAVSHIAADHVCFPAIIASAIRHITTDHVCFPAIIASAVSHIAADHVCFPAIIASAVSHIAADHVCFPAIVASSVSHIAADHLQSPWNLLLLLSLGSPWIHFLTGGHWICYPATDTFFLAVYWTTCPTLTNMRMVGLLACVYVLQPAVRDNGNVWKSIGVSLVIAQAGRPNSLQSHILQVSVVQPRWRHMASALLMAGSFVWYILPRFERFAKSSVLNLVTSDSGSVFVSKRRGFVFSRQNEWNSTVLNRIVFCTHFCWPLSPGLKLPELPEITPASPEMTPPSTASAAQEPAGSVCFFVFVIFCNPSARRCVWLEGVVPVLFLPCTWFFLVLLRVFASSELNPPPSPRPLPPLNTSQY